MHDYDEEAFMQIAFDDHPDGIDLEYRDGADKPLYHCKRLVLRLEAENALLDYLDGIFTKTKPQKTLEDLDDDDGGIDWRETDAKDVVADTRDGWAVLMDNVPVHEAKAAAQALDGAHIRCRLEILSEDRAYHRYGNGGLGTRMCVLVEPDDYEKAKKVVL